MSSASDKLTGKANALTGKIKRKIGEAVGSREFQMNGAMQQAKGTFQHTRGKIKSGLKSVIDKI